MKWFLLCEKTNPTDLKPIVLNTQEGFWEEDTRRLAMALIPCSNWEIELYMFWIVCKIKYTQTRGAFFLIKYHTIKIDFLCCCCCWWSVEVVLLACIPCTLRKNPMHQKQFTVGLPFYFQKSIHCVMSKPSMRWSEIIKH